MPSKYQERSTAMLSTRREKVLAFHIWLLRRFFYFLAAVNIWLAHRFVNTFSGMYLEAELGDSESWKWFKNWKLPRYVLKRKD